jgi:hypothetical protein
LALRDAREPAVLAPIVRAMGSASQSVRENAVDALGEIGHIAALAPLVSRLNALSTPQSSGGGGGKPSASIFVGRQFAYIQDFDVEVAQFAAVADPQVNVLTEGAVLDVRVHGCWQASPAVESRRVRTALHKISGEKPGDSNKAWLAWWDEHRARYEGDSPAPAPAPATSTSTSSALRQ